MKRSLMQSLWRGTEPQSGGLRRAKHKSQNQEEAHMSLNLSYEVSSLVNCSLYSVMINVNHPQKKI